MCVTMHVISSTRDTACTYCDLSFPRASRAKLQRLEKRLRETEKSKEELRQTQAKCAELERMNKKLQGHTHADRKEMIRLKEELHGLQAKVCTP